MTYQDSFTQIASQISEKADTESQRIHFSTYLSSVFKGLMTSENRLMRKSGYRRDPLAAPSYISRTLFYRYTQLPLLVSNGLYSALNLTQSGPLSEGDFVRGFEKLTLGTLEQKLEVVYRLLQLHSSRLQREELSKREARTLVYHIAISCGGALHHTQNYRSDSGFRSEHQAQNLLQISQNALMELFAEGKSTSEGEKLISYKQFLEFSITGSSDIAQIVLSFLQNRLMMSEKFKLYEKGVTNAKIQTDQPTDSKNNEGALTSQNQFSMTCLAPLHHIRNNWPLLTNNSLEASGALLEQLSPSPSIKERDLYLSLASYKSSSENLLPSKLEKPQSSFLLKRSRSHQILKSSTQAGLIYRFVDQKRIRPFWFELRGSDLYVFKKKSACTPKMIIPLGPGYYLVDKARSSLKSPQISKNNLFSFELVFPNGLKKDFMFLEEEQYQSWYQALSKVLAPAFDVEEHYEINDAIEISEDQVLCQGFSIITGESVEIMQIKKTEENIERTLERLEVLRVCQHPLVARNIQIHESLQYFYIVTEQVKGCSLPEYLQTKELSTASKISIIEQLTELLSFTKSLGLLIGNLSLPSIELVTANEEALPPQIRLVDLRQARICGQGQGRMEEISLFSAPELVRQQAAGSEADAFSLGMLMSQLLFDELPFGTIEQVVETEPLLPRVEEGMWKILSSQVSKLLVKDPQKRAKVEGIAKIIALL